MNFRKINRNRRKHRISNLVAGILNHFGESSIENLTKDVSIWSNQSMDFIDLAVRRTLRCGVRQGFLVQTARKTFKLSSRSHETDGNINRNLYDKVMYKKCYSNYEDGLTLGANSVKVCEAKDLIYHTQCPMAVPRNEYLCLFHTVVKSILQYRIIFVQNFNDESLRSVIRNNDEFNNTKKYIEGLSSIPMSDQDTYQNSLLDYLENHLAFLLSYEDEIEFWMVARPPGADTPSEYEREDSDNCVGLKLTDGSRCENQIKLSKLIGFYGLCAEHQYIAVALKGFTRYSSKDTQADSYFSMHMQQHITETENFTMKTRSCVTNYMTILFRYEQLLITGKPYLTPKYDQVIMNNVNHLHLKSERPTEGRCFCMHIDDVVNMFKNFKKIQDGNNAFVDKNMKNPKDDKRKPSQSQGHNNGGASKKSKRSR